MKFWYVKQIIDKDGSYYTNLIYSSSTRSFFYKFKYKFLKIINLNIRICFWARYAT